MTKDEARKIAAGIVKLPELVRKGKGRLGVLTVQGRRAVKSQKRINHSLTNTISFFGRSN
jgi:hypothetical protein